MVENDTLMIIFSLIDKTVAWKHALQFNSKLSAYILTFSKSWCSEFSPSSILAGNSGKIKQIY